MEQGRFSEILISSDGENFTKIGVVDWTIQGDGMRHKAKALRALAEPQQSLITGHPSVDNAGFPA